MEAAAISPPDALDGARFTELVRAHHLTLLSYARALCGVEPTARELVQDAFVAAWQSLGKFEASRDFAAWMRGIVRNKWREHCRLHAREIPFGEEALSRLEEILAPYSAGDAAILDRLAECRSKLPEPMKDAVRTCYEEGRNSAEAAAVLGLKAAAFRKRLERARDALRVCLSKSEA